ncbi:MAG: response regulator [Pseudolabrys sp.]
MAGTFRILHVDDDALTREVVALSLGRDPAFVLLSCASGEEALDVAAAWAPDLILCDVIMPNMDGQALLARLKADPATAAFQVVFMSGCADSDEALTARGAAGMIGKPFDAATLAATVRRYLHTIRLNAAGCDFARLPAQAGGALQRDRGLVARLRGSATDRRRETSPAARA